MLAFAMKVALRSAKIERRGLLGHRGDRSAPRDEQPPGQHGRRRPNDEFYLMGRLPKES
jgi:hypothetical protein